MNGRFAPSPTGTLHLGNLRTALLAWLFARSAGLLVPGAHGGPRRGPRAARLGGGAARRHGGAGARLGRRGGVPVRAAGRSTRPRWTSLRSRGLLYECFCTRAEIRAASSAPHGPLPEGAYPGTCLHLSAAELASKRAGGRPPALRVRADAAVVAFEDRLLGPVSGVVDDFVVRRNDGAPAYNLAVVVDDAAQGVERGRPRLRPRRLDAAAALARAGARAGRARARPRPARARPGRRPARQAPRRRDAARGPAGRRARLDGRLARHAPAAPPPTCSPSSTPPPSPATTPPGRGQTPRRSEMK